METISYTQAIIWYAMWPLAIYISYKFVRLNIEHLEENLENTTKEQQ